VTKPTIVDFYCSQCIEELVTAGAADPRDPFQHRLAIGVTAEADLVTWCARHDRVVFLYSNDVVAEALKMLAMRAVAERDAETTNKKFH
jgi:hypothetical protein